MTKSGDEFYTYVISYKKIKKQFTHVLKDVFSKFCMTVYVMYHLLILQGFLTLVYRILKYLLSGD